MKRMLVICFCAVCSMVVGWLLFSDTKEQMQAWPDQGTFDSHG